MAAFVPKKTIHLAGDVAPTPPARTGQTLVWDATLGHYVPGAPFAAVYNVLDNEVTGDGATDDQPALQALINKLLPVAFGGSLPPGKIEFPPGTYRLASTLNLIHARSIVFQGTGTNHPENPSYINWDGASGAGIRIDSSNGLQFRGLHIQATNPACTGDLISGSYLDSDIVGLLFIDCSLLGSGPSQPLRSLVKLNGSSCAVFDRTAFYFGQHALRLGVENYNIATTIQGRCLFVNQSDYSIYGSHLENLVIRDPIFEGGPDLAQHALKIVAPMTYGLLVEGCWAGDATNPPGGILFDLQNVYGGAFRSNRIYSVDTTFRIDGCVGLSFDGNEIESFGVGFLFAGVGSVGVCVTDGNALLMTTAYSGGMPSASYLTGTGFTWDAGAKTLMLSGSTTPGLHLSDGTRTGIVDMNTGLLRILNGNNGFNVSPTSTTINALSSIQTFGVNGNIGFVQGYDWTITNDVNANWGIRGTSVGGHYSVDIIHQAHAQGDPSLHGMRVVDLHSGVVGLHVDGNALTTLGGALVVGGGVQVKALLSASAVLDFPSVEAGGQQELTVSVTGAAVGDAVHLGPPAALEPGLAATARVSAADTATVRLVNVTGSAIDAASATWRVSVLKY